MRRLVLSLHLLALLLVPTSVVAQDDALSDPQGDAQDDPAAADPEADSQADVPTPPAEASAPQCAGGRVANEQTAGRCCWPGQTWNASAGRCEGPPQCPAGMLAQGDDCLQPAAAAPPPTGPSQPRGYGQPPGYGGMGYQPPQTHEEERPITGLIVGGSIAFGAAYVYSIIMGAIFLGSSGSCGVQNSWSMFIPLVGGYIWAGIDSSSCGFSGATGDILGIPGASVQVIGLGLLLVGALVKRTVRVPGPPPQAEVDLAPRLTSGPGELGLGLTWDF